MSSPQTSSSAHATQRGVRWTHVGLSRFSTVEFLVALALLLFTAPFVEQMPHGLMVEPVLLTVVLVLGVLAVGRSRRVLVAAVILVAPAVVGKWLNNLRPDLVPAQFFLISALVFVVFVVARLIGFVLRAPRVNSEVLCAGLSTYLLLGLLWSFAYLLVAQLDPQAFALTVSAAPHESLEGARAIYFSLITLSTVGYGDIVPISNEARMLAALEAMIGTLFVAVFIARLVALYSNQPPVADNPKGQSDSPS
jgi:hypothetical protein